MSERQRIVHKRKRTALSCYRCRSRKVKCGRELPSCLRCVKGGFAESCNYDSRAVHSENVTTRSNLANTEVSNDTEDHHREDGTWVSGEPLGRPSEHTFVNGTSDPVPTDNLPNYPNSIRRSQEDELYALKGRIDAILQSVIRGPSNSQDSRRDIRYPMDILGWGKGEVGSSVEGVFFRGKSFKTQYYGPSHLFSFVGEFPDLSQFMKDLINQIPVMRKARNELMALRSTEPNSPPIGNHYSRDKLLKLIPPRDEVDSLLQIYVNTFETTFRILHVPSFRKQYEQFWLSPEQNPDSFLITLLLVVTVVCSIPELEQASFVGFSSTRRNRAMESIDLCALWISQHSQKHITLAYFQVHCLLHLARRMNIVKVKRTWTGAGHILRIAMSTGLHREPSVLAHKISVFDQEMRRRLWATIAEFELHDSLDRGMAPAIRDGSWDSKPPANIHDEEFDQDSKSLPASRPTTEFTDTAFLHQSSQTLSFRTELIARINRIGSPMSYEEVLSQDEKLMQCVAEIPQWDAKSLVAQTTQASNRAFLARSLLWLQLQQFLLLIHRPFAHDGRPVSRYRYSKSSCITSAISILNLYTRPDITRDFSLVVMRTDLFRAAFSLCYDIATLNSSNTDFDITPPLLDNGESSMHLIETALKFLEDKVMRLGQAMHQYLFLISAFCLAQMKLRPTDASKWQKEAADRMTYLCYRVLSNQASMYAPPNNTPASNYQNATNQIQTSLPTYSFPTPSASDLGPVMPNLNEFSIDSFSQADLWAWDPDEVWNT